jgi:hypothetical protein
MNPTIAFFTEKLGFTVDTAVGKEPRFAMLCRDDITVMLACKSMIPWPHKGWAVYVWVNDVDALAAEFKTRHLALKCGPTVKEYGCKEVEVLMPDGRTIAFGQAIS